jgi:hypothetical protein
MPSSTIARYWLEAHDHTGKFLADLPYKDIQGEWQLNDKGQALRCSIPYRGNKSKVNTTTVKPGKTELWLYDRQVSVSDPIFAGPLWDATASSDGGLLSCAAQDPGSYLAKRVLKASKQYSNTTGANKIADLIAYVNSVYGTQIVATVVKNNAQSSSVTYKAIERAYIQDLITSITALDDKVEYFFRTTGTTHGMQIYGGSITPTPGINALEYGGNLDGYSVQDNAQTIANDVDVVSSNGRVGNAVNAAKQAEYGALYQEAQTGSDLTSTTSLNNSAATELKDTQSSKIIPSLTTRRLTPIKDFDFGSQFTVVISDDYVQVNQLIRVVGWQLSVAQGDKTTTVIYTKDTEGVS